MLHIVLDGAGEVIVVGGLVTWSSTSNGEPVKISLRLSDAQIADERFRDARETAVSLPDNVVPMPRRHAADSS